MNTNMSDERAEIVQRGTDAKLAAKMWLGWQLDALRVRVGQAEIVDVPAEPLERRFRRNQKPASAMPEGTRLMFQAGRVYFVRDTVA